MNIHPIIVHFAIALLTLYAFLEVLPLTRWHPKTSREDIKAVLVAFGGLGLLVALEAGEWAEGSFLAQASASVLHLHKEFAAATTAIFGIIAVAYLIRWIFEKHVDLLGTVETSVSFLKSIVDFLLQRWIAVPLALIGFVVLFITGTLGEIIVHGSNFNLVTNLVSDLFQITI